MQSGDDKQFSLLNEDALQLTIVANPPQLFPAVLSRFLTTAFTFKINKNIKIIKNITK